VNQIEYATGVEEMFEYVGEHNDIEPMFHTREHFLDRLCKHLDAQRCEMLDTDIGELNRKPSGAWMSLPEGMQDVPKTRADVQDFGVGFADMRRYEFRYGLPSIIVKKVILREFLCVSNVRAIHSALAVIPDIVIGYCLGLGARNHLYQSTHVAYVQPGIAKDLAAVVCIEPIPANWL
jgi:hypothetical protein